MYQADGTIANLDEIMAEADDAEAEGPGPFDGLLGADHFADDAFEDPTQTDPWADEITG